MLPRNRALLSRKYKFGEAKSCADGQCVVQIIHEVIYVKLMEEHSKKKKTCLSRLYHRLSFPYACYRPKVTSENSGLNYRG